MLDAESAALGKDYLSEDNKLLPNFNPAVGAYYYFNDDQTAVSVCKQSPSHLACVRAPVGEDNKLLPNFNPAVGAYYYFNDDQTAVSVCKQSPSHLACVKAPVGEDKTVIYEQSGTVYTQMINKGGSTTITLIQR